jgi:hypothetical protein
MHTTGCVPACYASCEWREGAGAGRAGPDRTPLALAARDAPGGAWSVQWLHAQLQPLAAGWCRPQAGDEPDLDAVHGGCAAPQLRVQVCWAQ